jgi:ATP-dependent Clp protease ATP-binding subunit ClpB
MAAIVDIQLARLIKRLAERGIAIELDKKAKAWLGDKGYDPIYGARPLKRVIQRNLENPLAMAVLEGRVGAVVHVSAGEDGLIIDGAKVQAAA